MSPGVIQEMDVNGMLILLNVLNVYSHVLNLTM